MKKKETIALPPIKASPEEIAKRMFSNTKDGKTKNIKDSEK